MHNPKLPNIRMVLLPTVSKTLPSEQKKVEMNSVPQLEVMCKGMPCLEKTWRMNSLASMGDVMVLTVGIKIDCLVRWSMMSSIVSELLDIGSFLMKSMDIEFQGLSGIRSCNISTLYQGFHNSQ